MHHIQFGDMQLPEYMLFVYLISCIFINRTILFYMNQYNIYAQLHFKYNHYIILAFCII